MKKKETENIFQIINNKFSSMSRGQKKLARFIMTDYDRAAFLTASKIGYEVGVSESTVVRFAAMLGLKGFPQLQGELEKMVRRRIHEPPAVDIDNENISRQEVLEQVLKRDMENIRYTMEQINRNAFEAAVELLLAARKVYIIGIRNSTPLAACMEASLKLMLNEVILLSSDNSSNLFEDMLRMNEEDCIVGISFPRYSIRTLKAMEFANSRNCRVITITDSETSPMNLYSSCNLIAKSEMTSVAESLTAPLSVINALVTALMAKRKKNLVNRLEMLEDICNEYAVSGNDELNWVDDSDLAKKPL
ncbi:MAG: MurR/RpiR family transcriptional regulator [Lachnospiraceae bacterium]|nr:MurR/RpiR family transcriptional regulator [Lachnospiraceae bacterium]